MQEIINSAKQALAEMPRLEPSRKYFQDNLKSSLRVLLVRSRREHLDIYKKIVDAFSNVSIHELNSVYEKHVPDSIKCNGVKSIVDNLAFCEGFIITQDIFKCRLQNSLVFATYYLGGQQDERLSPSDVVVSVTGDLEAFNNHNKRIKEFMSENPIDPAIYA